MNNFHTKNAEQTSVLGVEKKDSFSSENAEFAEGNGKLGIEKISYPIYIQKKKISACQI